MTRTMTDKLADDVATLLDQTKGLSMRVRALSHDAEVADRDDDPIWQDGFAEQFEQSRAKLIKLRNNDRELYERMAKFENDLRQGRVDPTNQASEAETLRERHGQLVAQMDAVQSEVEATLAAYREARQAHAFEVDAERERVTNELEQVRQKLNYSVADLARLTEIDGQKLRRIFTGKQRMTDDVAKALRSISHGFDRIVTDLAGDTGGLTAALEQANPEPLELPDNVGACPACGHDKSKVIFTGLGRSKGAAAAASEKDRIRQCEKCGHNWRMIEISETAFNELAKYADALKKYNDALDTQYQNAWNFLKDHRELIVEGAPNKPTRRDDADLREQLAKLKALFDDGLITEAVYEQKMARLIDTL